MLFLILTLTQHAARSTRHAETITVTATKTETRLADTPASMVVVAREALQATAAATMA